MTAFPTLSKGIDSESFRQAYADDPAVRSSSDGGYVITRPRYKRTPRKTFEFRFRDVTEADRVALIDTFWAVTVKGGSLDFTFTHPVTGAIHNVRFSEGSKPQASYKGRGSTVRWDIENISLTEV